VGIRKKMHKVNHFQFTLHFTGFLERIQVKNSRKIMSSCVLLTDDQAGAVS